MRQYSLLAFYGACVGALVMMQLKDKAVQQDTQRSPYHVRMADCVLLYDRVSLKPTPPTV